MHHNPSQEVLAYEDTICSQVLFLLKSLHFYKEVQRRKNDKTGDLQNLRNVRLRYCWHIFVRQTCFFSPVIYRRNGAYDQEMMHICFFMSKQSMN